MSLSRSLCPAILLPLAALSCGCKHRPEPPRTAPIAHSDNLRLLARRPLAIPEPSGLALAADKQSLWAVSDANGRVYRLDLEGKVLSSFSTGLKDLEDIEVIDEETLAVVTEGKRRIVLFGAGGRLLGEGGVDIPGNDNAGPESLAFDRAASRYYVMKEHSPGTFLTLDAGFNELSRTVLTFAQDYSSLVFEETRGHLWIMSDVARAVYVTDRDFKIQTVFSTGVPQQEGLAVDYDRKKLYIVSDSLEELYVFEFDKY